MFNVISLYIVWLGLSSFSPFSFAPVRFLPPPFPCLYGNKKRKGYKLGSKFLIVTLCSLSLCVCIREKREKTGVLTTGLHPTCSHLASRLLGKQSKIHTARGLPAPIYWPAYNTLSSQYMYTAACHTARCPLAAAGTASKTRPRLFASLSSSLQI